jgi:hypothetical protein
MALNALLVQTLFVRIVQMMCAKHVQIITMQKVIHVKNVMMHVMENVQVLEL